MINRVKEIAKYVTTGWRRTLLTIVMVLVSLLVIARIIIGNWELFTSQEWTFEPIWIGYALLFFLLDFGLSLYAWHLLVSKYGGFNNFKINTKISLQSNLARRIPGSFWYVASRAVMYEELGITKRTTSMLSALEMIFFIVSGGLVSLVTIPFWFSRQDSSQITNQVLWLAILLPIGLLLVHPKVFQALWKRITREEPFIEPKLSDTSIWLGMYLGTWLLGGLVLYSLIRVFTELPAGELVMVIGIWSLAGTISLVGFITISVFGLRELSLVLLLSTILPLPLALIIAVAVRLLWLSGELLSALLSFRL
jgi:hypothetical protein